MNILKNNQLQNTNYQAFKEIEQSTQSQALAKKITWTHGTNSSLLALIPRTDYTLIPSGKLLDRQIAPMSGEITQGGMTPNGVNQTLISGCLAKDINISWNYADKTSHSFDIHVCIAKEFKSSLDVLMRASPEHDEWDSTLISLLRLKQWDPKEFEQLCFEHRNTIETIKKESLERSPSKRVLKAIDCPLEELEKAKEDLEAQQRINAFIGGKNGINWIEKPDGKILFECREVFFYPKQSVDLLNQSPLKTPSLIKTVFRLRLYGNTELELLREVAPRFEKTEPVKALLAKDKKGRLLSAEAIIQRVIREKIELRLKHYHLRYNRMLSIFDNPPLVQFRDVERQMIALHFPLLLASTHVKPVESYHHEYKIQQAIIGKEIDLFFVKPEHVPAAQDWLKDHNLQERISVYPSTLIDEIEKIARIEKPFWKKIFCCC